MIFNESKCPICKGILNHEYWGTNQISEILSCNKKLNHNFWLHKDEQSNRVYEISIHFGYNKKNNAVWVFNEKKGDSLMIINHINNKTLQIPFIDPSNIDWTKIINRLKTISVFT